MSDILYFKLVTKLEIQHPQKLQEREKWKATVSSNQATIDGI